MSQIISTKKRKASEHPQTDQLTTKQQQTGCLDKFSYLPLVIIHDILSKIPIKERIRSCVLSKKWRTIWASRPVLDFHEPFFEGTRQAFLTYLENSLDYHDKYGFSGTEIRYLFLEMKVEKNSHIELLVKKLIDFACRNKVQMLRLRIKMCEFLDKFDWRDIYYYDLRDTSFSIDALESLDIDNCEISNCSFMFPNLKSLRLSNVSIEDGDLGNLIAACPRIEELMIVRCPKFFTIVVSNPVLKSFLLGSPRGGCKIKIESKNLESFQLCSVYKLKVEVNTMKTVKSLKLHEVRYPKRMMMCFINKFPQLEELILYGCSGLRSLHVSQANLTSFEVMSCDEIKEIRLDAPKLKSLDYFGGRMSFTGLESSKALESVKLNLRPHSLDDGSLDDCLLDDDDDCFLDDQWYIWLRNTLESFAHSKHLSLICGDAKDIVFPGKLTERLLPTINDLKNLELEIYAYSAFTSQQIIDSFIRILPGLKTLLLTSGRTSELFELPQGG